MKTILALLFYLTTLSANEALMLTHRDAGFFSIFMDVTTTLSAYEKGLIRGFSIDFSKQGLYYDPAVGPNWWEYYFAPLSIGDLTPPIRPYCGLNEFSVYPTNEECCALIQKYIHINSDIQQEVDAFAAAHFKNRYVIAIHYRGTDKCFENPRVPYEKMFSEIRRALSHRPKKKPCTIFVATDEQPFIEALSKFLKGKGNLCYIDIDRSPDNSMPIYHNPLNSPYDNGRSALIDCLLLSKGNILIRTESNLSACSLYFNPTLKCQIVTP